MPKLGLNFEPKRIKKNKDFISQIGNRKFRYIV